MNWVQRYEVRYAHDITQKADGTFVTYEAYERLEAENHKLKLTMQLHAGDCCSLNNEVALFRGHWDDAEGRCEELEKENRRLKNENHLNKL